MRLLRRLAVLLVAVVGLAIAGGWIFLTSERGRRFVLVELEQVLAAASGGTVHIASVETGQLGLLVLHDLSVSLGGQSWLRSERVEIAYRLPLPSPLTIRLARATAYDLDAHLVVRDGRLGPPAAARAGGSSARLRIGRLEIRDGRIAVELADGEPRRFALSDLALDSALALGPGTTRLDVGRLVAIPRGLPLAPLRASLHLVHGGNGRLALDDLDAYVGASHLEGRGVIAPDGTISLAARADPVTARTLRALVPSLTPAGPVAVELALAGPRSDLRGTVSLALPDDGRVTLEGHGDLSGPRLAYRLHGRAEALRLQALRPDLPGAPTTLALDARGRGDRHRVALRASTAAGAATLQAAVHLDEVPDYDATMRATVTKLSALRPGTDGHFPLRATIAGEGNPLAGGHATVDAVLGGGTLGGRAFDEAVIAAVLREGHLTVEEARVQSGQTTVAASGRANLAAATAELTVEARREDRGTLAAAVTVRREGTGWLGRIERATVEPVGLAPWRTVAPASFALGERMRLEPLRLASGAQRLSLAGTLGAGGALDATVEWAGVDLAALCRLASPQACEGRSGGTLAVAGTTAAPRLALDASVEGLTAGPVHGAAVTARATYAAERVRGAIEVAALRGTIRVEGSLPLALSATPAAAEGPLDLQLTARDLKLGRLAKEVPGLVRTAQGQAGADLHLGGTWAAPQPRGTLWVRAPRLELEGTGAPWRDVEIVLRAAGGSRLAVEQMRARGGDGTLRGSGSLDLASGLLPVADLRLELDRFLAVKRPLLDAQATGRLTVRGPLDAPVVRGRISVPEATIRPAFLPASQGPLTPDPTIEVVGAAKETERAPVAGLGELTLGVTIALGDDVRIRRQDADIELGGSIRVERIPPGPLVVHGAIDVERGWYTFSGRRFTLRPGSIRFEGGPPQTAKLDIEATYRAGEYDVTVRVTGTVAQPALLLESDPPLPDADILSVLVFGRPAGELSDEERLRVQAEAVSLAASYAFGGEGSGGLAQSLGLESLEVSPERLSVSRRVFGDVFLSLSQEFTGWAGQTVGVAYDVTKRLSVQLSTSTRGSGAIDMLWRRRY